MTGIYLITNKINGKQYVGQSKNIEKRFLEYKSLNCKNQKALYNAFSKYGVNNFRFEVIHECIINDLNKMEGFFIYHFKTLSPLGYNLTSGGGQCSNYSYESKMRVSLGKCKGIKDYSGYGLVTAFNEYNEIVACGDIFEVSKQVSINVNSVKWAMDSKDYTPHHKDGKIKIYFISNCESRPDRELCEYMAI